MVELKIDGIQYKFCARMRATIKPAVCLFYYRSHRYECFRCPDVEKKVVFMHQSAPQEIRPRESRKKTCRNCGYPLNNRATYCHPCSAAIHLPASEALVILIRIKKERKNGGVPRGRRPGFHQKKSD